MWECASFRAGCNLILGRQKHIRPGGTYHGSFITGNKIGFLAACLGHKKSVHMHMTKWIAPKVWVYNKNRPFGRFDKHTIIFLLLF